MKKNIFFLIIILSFVKGFAQIKIDSTHLYETISSHKIVLLYTVEAPYNILNLIKNSFPEYKFAQNEKIYFSYFKQDSIFFSIGRINFQNKNLKINETFKSGVLNGKILLPYQAKINKNHIIIIVSKSNKFPISIE